MTTLAELLAARLPAPSGNASVRVVFGTVTAVSPLTVLLAGSTTPVPGVAKAKNYTAAVGDTVRCEHIDGAALFVVCAVG